MANLKVITSAVIETESNENLEQLSPVSRCLYTAVHFDKRRFYSGLALI